MLIEFELPIEAVAKGRPRMGKWGAYTPEKTRVFEARVRQLAERYRPEKPLEGPLVMTCEFHLVPPKKRPKWNYPITRPDTDNYCKAILDSLNHDLKKMLPGFYLDDSQVYDIRGVKLYSWVEKTPKIVIRIQEQNIPAPILGKLARPQ